MARGELASEKKQSRPKSYDKSFTCKLGDKNSSGKSHLEVQCEEDKKDFVCDQCGESFHQEQQFKAHRRIHSEVGETGKSVPTPQLYSENERLARGYTNEFGTQLLTHSEDNRSCDGSVLDCCGELTSQRRVHTAEEKPFACIVCRKRFTRKGVLKVHLRLHTGEKPHVCEICGKCFTHKTTCIKHQFSHTGERPHTCEVCRKGFLSTSDLRRHGQVHDAEKRSVDAGGRFTCEKCSRCFNQERHLKMHARFHAD